MQDPALWWRYNRSLDTDLVVITSALDGETGLDAAGELPWRRIHEWQRSVPEHSEGPRPGQFSESFLQAMAAGG